VHILFDNNLFAYLNITFQKLVIMGNNCHNVQRWIIWGGIEWYLFVLPHHLWCSGLMSNYGSSMSITNVRNRDINNKKTNSTRSTTWPQRSPFAVAWGETPNTDSG